MRVLFDTCIWSLSLRRKSSAVLSQQELQSVTALTQAIQGRQAAIIGPIRQEILSGIRDPAMFQKIKEALSVFRDEDLVSADFEEAARLDNLCRSRGVSPGPIDILICAVARRRNWGISTSDQGLLRCLEVVT
jgi:predicted nucleic acid-binding protein